MKAIMDYFERSSPFFFEIYQHYSIFIMSNKNDYNDETS